MGAEICGVQVADIDDETFAAIEHALFRQKMIYFREQENSHAEQELSSRRFGAFADDAYTG
jgi:taurine dioxygenase